MFWLDRLEAEEDLENYLQKIAGIKTKDKLSITVNINIAPAMINLKRLQAELSKTMRMSEHIGVGV